MQDKVVVVGVTDGIGTEHVQVDIPISKAIAQYGNIDVLVNAAGAGAIVADEY